MGFYFINPANAWWLTSSNFYVENAGFLAVQILSVGEVKLPKKMLDYKDKMNLEVMKKVKKLKGGN